MTEQKQESLLTLFGMSEEAPIIIKKGAEKPVVSKEGSEAGTKASKVAKTKASTKKEEPPKPIGKPVTVRLYGENINFDDVNLTLEDIREILERDFPEFSKAVTTMHFDEEKALVVPVVTLKPKG